MSILVADILQDIRRLEPFPQAAIRVMELALNDADPEEVIAVLECDPGLMIKVMGIANSARYAPRKSIDSLAEAVLRLGSKTVASIAMTTGSASFFMGYGDSTPRSNISLWKECMHVAFFSRHLAQKSGDVGPELAYTVGLLQNVGNIVLDRFLEDSRDEIKSRYEHGEDLQSAERAVLGMDHAQCGAHLARKWKLPAVLVSGIRFHHSPEDAGSYSKLCAIVNYAEGLTFQTVVDRGTSLLIPGIDPGPSIEMLDKSEREQLAQQVRNEVIATGLGD